jgi:hypothetical protein
VIGPASVVILRDVQIAQPDLAVVDGGESVSQRRLTVAQAFYLGAHQLDPRLEGIQDRIVVPRFAIRRDNPVVAGPRRVRLLCHGYLRT